MRKGAVPSMADTPGTGLEGATTMSGRRSGFRALIGYRAIVWTRDYAEIELTLADQHMNSLGITHGGVYMAMMDAAMGHASTWCAVNGNVRLCVTVSLTTNFIAPARDGSIRAIGRLIGIHNRIATLTAEVIDGDCGTLLAAGQGGFRYFPGSESYDGVPKGASGR